MGGLAVRDDGENGERGQAFGLLRVDDDGHEIGADDGGSHDGAALAIEVDRLGAPTGDTGIGREHHEHRRAAVLGAQDGLVGGPGVALVRVAGDGGRGEGSECRGTDVWRAY